MAIDILRFIFRLLLRLFTYVEAHGVENIPLEGGCIVAPNHLGALDVPLLGIHILRNDASFLAAKKHRRFPTSLLIDALGGIWIDRYNADLRALRQARDFLRAGNILGVAPEGTRSPNHALIAGKPGAAYLASLANAPIVPVGITGTENAFEQLRRLRRPHLTIRFGKPFTLPPLDPDNREAALRRNTDEIMCRIAALLPPAYRGVYANHPRLQELLAESKSSNAPVAMAEPGRD